jgi:phosphatidylinositol kinase/protein kinase (PI-3  family)
MHVITSKQRPRRLHLHGSDGKDYGYLLKGHEDLRQDERVMQLFGLVNSLLANTPATSGRDLSIARYAVVPLSPNSGLIGWVPNCDTLHALIREHRDAHKVPLNLEQRLMLAMAPDYDHLPLVNKVRRERRLLKRFVFFPRLRLSFFFSLRRSRARGAARTFAVMRRHTSTESSRLTAAASVRAD